MPTRSEALAASERATPDRLPVTVGHNTRIASMEALVCGVARLVEGQRQFADEFGLPYGRVFDDAFESFKSRDTRDVLRHWLTSDEGAGQLQKLLCSLACHQLAVLQAAEQVTADSPRAANGWLARALQRGRCAEGQACDLVLAYTNAREHLAAERLTEFRSC